MQQELILSGTVVSMKDCIYKPDIFEMEDETARQIAQRLLDKTPCPNINSLLEQVKSRFGLSLSAMQSKGVQQACIYNLSIITGPPGSGKTSAIKANHRGVPGFCVPRVSSCLWLPPAAQAGEWWKARALRRPALSTAV